MNGTDALEAERIVGKLDKGESGPFPGACLCVARHLPQAALRRDSNEPPK
jgi:hypothetical protein